MTDPLALVEQHWPPLAAVTGQTVTLGLIDPDSNALVPEQSPRFGGDFVLAAQGDQQLVFADELGRGAPQLTPLTLTHGGASAGVDDVRWTTSHKGTLIAVDNAANAVYGVNGPFQAGDSPSPRWTAWGACPKTTRWSRSIWGPAR